MDGQWEHKYVGAWTVLGGTNQMAFLSDALAALPVALACRPCLSVALIGRSPENQWFVHWFLVGIVDRENNGSLSLIIYY